MREVYGPRTTFEKVNPQPFKIKHLEISFVFSLRHMRRSQTQVELHWCQSETTKPTEIYVGSFTSHFHFLKSSKWSL